jgi:hypothetical protein
LISAIGDESFLSALPGDVLDESIGLEDACVREAVEDGVAVAPARDESGSTKHRKVLAHVGDLAAHLKAEVAHRELADGERLEDAQALRVRERATDGGVPLSIELGGDWEVIQHGLEGITFCANSHVAGMTVR